MKAELLLQLRSVVAVGLCQWKPGGGLSGAENLAGRLNSLQLGSQYIAVRLWLLEAFGKYYREQGVGLTLVRWLNLL